MKKLIISRTFKALKILDCKLSIENEINTEYQIKNIDDFTGYKKELYNFILKHFDLEKADYYLQYKGGFEDLPAWIENKDKYIKTEYRIISNMGKKFLFDIEEKKEDGTWEIITSTNDLPYAEYFVDELKKKEAV